MTERLPTFRGIDTQKREHSKREQFLAASSERKMWEMLRKVGPENGIKTPKREITPRALLPEDDHEEEDEHPFEDQARWLAFGLICAAAFVLGIASVGTFMTTLDPITARASFGLLVITVCAVILAWRNIIK